MNLSLTDIQKKVEDYAGKINAPAYLLPSFDNWEECHPNIVLDAGNQLRYEIYERCQQISNEFAADENDLYYRVFRDVSFSMGQNYELQNRNPRKDFRRILFAKQQELLGILDESWKERIQKEHQATLQSNPFDDNITQRIDYYNKLMKSGKKMEQAMSESNKKFPATKH